MVQSKKCEDLEEEVTQRVSDALPDWGSYLTSEVGEIGALGKADDSLTDDVRFGGARKRNQNYLDEQRTGYEGNVGNEAQDTITPQNKKTLSLTASMRLAFFLSVFSLHSFSRSWC